MNLDFTHNSTFIGGSKFPQKESGTSSVKNEDAENCFISFELFDVNLANEVFRPDWPIYTLTHDTPPATYGNNAKVINSFISNGTIIDGHVENSVLSRRVVVKKGAVVKNSIILTRTVIEEGAHIENVLIDKYSHVCKNAVVKGTTEKPKFIAQGKNIL